MYGWPEMLYKLNATGQVHALLDELVSLTDDD
jgi:hypothetical protein